MSLVRVGVTGACGKMGQEVVKGLLNAPDLELVGVCDVVNVGKDLGEVMKSKELNLRIYGNLEKLIEEVKPHVVIDFTRKEVAHQHILLALGKGVAMVVGTTGFSKGDYAELDAYALECQQGLLIAPNFSLGAVVMMKWAREAARYFPQAEIIEFHNDKKIDSPSGTALATACGIKYKEEGMNGLLADSSPCRGGEYYGVKIHSVRLNSLIAHQEVLFSGHGEILTIRHDSYSRESFIPGVLLATRKVSSWQGLKIGLECILD